MGLDYLTLDIEYDLKRNCFRSAGNLNEEGQKDVIELFLASERGKGVDNSERKERDSYNIRIKWYPHEDGIIVSSNTGNKGLRDGILLSYLESLTKPNQE